MASFGEITRESVDLARRLGMRVRHLSNGAPVLLSEGGEKLVSILTGLHGEERVGPYFVRNLLRSWHTGGQRPPISFVIVPVLNDEGWDRGARTWRRQDTNTHFDHTGKIPHVHELMQLYAELEPLPSLHWDIHEDSESKKPYVWLYKDVRADPENAALAHYMDVDTHKWTRMSDGSSEVFMRKLGVPWVVTTEVPPTWPFGRRLAWVERAYDYIIPRVLREPAHRSVERMRQMSGGYLRGERR